MPECCSTGQIWTCSCFCQIILKSRHLNASWSFHCQSCQWVYWIWNWSWSWRCCDAVSSFCPSRANRCWSFIAPRGSTQSRSQSGTYRSRNTSPVSLFCLACTWTRLCPEICSFLSTFSASREYSPPADYSTLLATFWVVFAAWFEFDWGTWRLALIGCHRRCIWWSQPTCCQISRRQIARSLFRSAFLRVFPS